ncbi:MAG: hypothetical protein L0226_04955 [Acidobacteria bacterium]|nr:hypothetical protein [Acidobacteriota bacterium]
MNIRLSWRGMVIGLVVFVILSFATVISIKQPSLFVSATNSQPFSSTIHASQVPEVVEAIQLPSVNGIVPVEIRNQKITHNTPQGELQFTVKNNTNKPLIAAVIANEVTYLVGGQELKGLSYRTRNLLIHPDISEIHNQKPIAPGGEMIFKPEPIEFVGANGKIVPVKKITLSLDYVDFEDNTSLGPNKHGLYSVIKVREGAVKYREWLVKQFAESGKSENALLSLLRESGLPAELNLPKDHQITGARLYRRHLLSAYDHHGFIAIEKFLR